MMILSDARGDRHKQEMAILMSEEYLLLVGFCFVIDQGVHFIRETCLDTFMIITPTLDYSH